MDEILASIRRIIESGDEKPVPALAATAARSAGAEKVAGSREASAERGEARPLGAAPPRVVPFYDRSAAKPSVAADLPQPAVEASDLWTPPAETVSLTDEPAEGVEEPKLESVPEGRREAESAIAPVDPVDRWTQEFDDVASWSVLDAPADPAPVPAASAEAAHDEIAEPELKQAAEAPADDVRPEGRSFVAEAEPDVAPAQDAAQESDEDDDFVVDFNEADFVEALDRNAGLTEGRREAQRPPQPSNDTARLLSSIDPSIFELPERLGASVLLRERQTLATPAAVEAPAAVPPSSVMEEASALMSDEAGSQVAAAFDDLARTIREGQMKSMEEMAREMLRPMLQEWLDDNLPRMVERLVREEIERVSRGGRR